MKTVLIMAFLAATLGSSYAEETILVETRIVDGPASLKLSKSDFETRAILEYPGLNMLTAPRMTLVNGKSGMISVQETRSVRSAEDNKEMRVPTGVQLKIFRSRTALC